MFDRYKVRLTLMREMLGTNPIDPHVHDTHILDRQRKLIAQNKDVNKEVNKYLGQLEISEEKGEEEKNRILDKLQELIGAEFTEEERVAAIRGELESLKETFKELDIKGITVFFWDKKKNLPCIGDHMIYGFMKAAAEAIGRITQKSRGQVFGSVSYTNSLINQHVRCREQFITFDKDLIRNEDGTPLYKQRSLRAMTAKGPRISLAKSEQIEAGANLEFVLNVMQGSPIDEKVIRKLFSYGEMSGLGQWRNAGNGMFSAEITKLQ